MLGSCKTSFKISQSKLLLLAEFQECSEILFYLCLDYDILASLQKVDVGLLYYML